MKKLFFRFKLWQPSEWVGSDVAEFFVKKAEDYIGELGTEVNRLAAHAERKTIKAEDIKMAVEIANPFFRF